MRQRVLRARFDRCGECQQRVFRPAADGLDCHELRLASGQRAGLVDHKRVDLLERLPRLGILDEHARRSEERRGGTECDSTCRSRWSQYHSKQHNKNTSTIELTLSSNPHSTHLSFYQTKL